MDRDLTTDEARRAERRDVIVDAAEQAGLLTGQRDQIAARIHHQLLLTAKQKSGLASTTEVVEYALARVALEDGFAEAFLALEGSIPPDLDLEF